MCFITVKQEYVSLFHVSWHFPKNLPLKLKTEIKEFGHM